MGKLAKPVSSNAALRAASYCRASGEGQRDNTSIPRQRDGNAEFIATNKWALFDHYVDECKSGSKEEGRDGFQRLMRDAALGKFGIVVVYDIKRFSRDGADIIRNSGRLRKEFGVHVVDTKNQFDTRDRRNALINYVHAGVSEQERLDIMERMIGGRVRRAKDGLPWSGNRPAGRDFKETDKHAGYWYVTERGEQIREMLTRYADGEPLKELAPEYGFSSPAVVLTFVRSSQLSGPYVATFNAPEIEIEDLKVPVPTMPEVITPELERRVRLRMQHNRNWTKEGLRKYRLSGFVFCENCGRALTSACADGHIYYRHHHITGRTKHICGFSAIPGVLLEPHSLDYLLKFFLDRPSFDAAVKASIPSDEDRAKLEAEIKKTSERLNKVTNSINKLVDAVANGADVGILVSKQGQLKAERDANAARLAELQAEFAALPDMAQFEEQAQLLRMQLVLQHKGKDWRTMAFDEVRQFLRHLFGDNTKTSGLGIFVRREGPDWILTFKGHAKFNADVVNGRVSPHALQAEGVAANRELKRVYEQALKQGMASSLARCSGGLRLPR